MADPGITILLLGDAGVGKSTFLSYVSLLLSLGPCGRSYDAEESVEAQLVNL